MRHQANRSDSAAYTEFAPPGHLLNYVEACWFYQPRFQTLTRDILIPEGVVDIIFNFGEAYFRQNAVDAENADWVGGDVAVAQRNELFVVEWPVDTRLFALRLKPEAAYLFFDFSMRRITNRTVPLAETELAGLAKIVHGFRFEDQARIASACFEHLWEAVSSSRTPDSRLVTVIRAIRQLEGNVDIQQLCDELEFNRRTVQRLFAEKVGISPKFLARTIRLHHFLYRRHEHSDTNLTDTALSAQFYDQSHLIKDFKRFTGESPAKFFNSPPEIYEPLLASLHARRRSELS